MRTLPCLCGALLFAVTLRAADPDPCALVSKAEVAKLLGELKEGPKPETGIQKEKECHYANLEGAWLKASLYSSERWGMQRGTLSEMNPTELPGLGEEAFGVRRGTTYELYLRKGKWMLEISTTAGPEGAKKFAETAAKQLP